MKAAVSTEYGSWIIVVTLDTFRNVLVSNKLQLDASKTLLVVVYFVLTGFFRTFVLRISYTKHLILYTVDYQ